MHSICIAFCKLWKAQQLWFLYIDYNIKTKVLAKSVVPDGKWEKLGNSDTFQFIYVFGTDYKPRLQICFLLFPATWACTQQLFGSIYFKILILDQYWKNDWYNLSQNTTSSDSVVEGLNMCY